MSRAILFAMTTQPTNVITCAGQQNLLGGSQPAMNLQVKSSTYCEIDMGINEGIPNDMLLIIYAVHDRQIQIDQNREIVIVE